MSGVHSAFDRDSLASVNVPRRCSRPGCPHYAVATLTYVYSDSTAVVGPLATVREPHSWDLCLGHASRITAPRGWELVRHAAPLPANPDEDDLVALADAVREGRVAPGAPMPGFSDPLGRRSTPWYRSGRCPTAAAAAISGCCPTPPTERCGTARLRGHAQASRPRTPRHQGL